MKLTRTLAMAAVLVIPLSLTALPVQAQQRDRATRGRNEAPRQEQAKGARQYRNAPPTRTSPDSRSAPQSRIAPQSRNAPQFRGAPELRNIPRAAVPRAVPRVVVPAPYGGSRSNGYRSYNYRPGLRGSSVYRPYVYTFRPRVRVGFGVFLGYPIAYPSYTTRTPIHRLTVTHRCRATAPTAASASKSRRATPRSSSTASTWESSMTFTIRAVLCRSGSAATTSACRRPAIDRSTST